MKRSSIGLLLVIGLAASVCAQESARSVDPAELREATGKALAAVQKSQTAWREVETCVSCHHQLIPELTFRLARERKISHIESDARAAAEESFSSLGDLDAAIQGYDSFDPLSDGWTLVAADAAGVRQSLSTTAWALSLARRQRGDGSWNSCDVRPPQSHGTIVATAVCAGGIRRYLPDEQGNLRQACLERARKWLVQATARTTDDLVFRLLGLRWTSASEEQVSAAARQLSALQHVDGGWSQLPTYASDPYATGQVLAVLLESGGLHVGDPACQRGLRFLLESQHSDGSWRVASRLHPPAPVSPDYFETGFPYEKHQFISVMGTCWAANALMQALPAAAGPPRRIHHPDQPAAKIEQWVDSALMANVEELKKLLDQGLDANAKTAKGTTALMIAAHDFDKVRLLVERGADVNARSDAGFTPLMVAARYPGNSNVVRWLLRHGADHGAMGGQSSHVLHKANALYLAAASGDVQTLDVLFNAGARLEDRVIIFGKYAWSPLFIAINGGDAASVEALVRHGADPNERDEPGVSPLGWGAIGNHSAVIRVLLANGAKVNEIDGLGMTPLLYAASIDFGDTEVVELLLGANADPGCKDKQGLTPAGLAELFGHTAITKLLRLTER